MRAALRSIRRRSRTHSCRRKIQVANGVLDAYVHLSICIEHIDDIIADLEKRSQQLDIGRLWTEALFLKG